MSDKKLLPCMCCGGEAQFVKLRETYGIPLGYVQCTECGLRLGQENCTEDFARNKWNTRVPIQKIVERLEEKAKEYTNEDLSRKIPWFGIDEAIDIVKEEGGFCD